MRGDSQKPVFWCSSSLPAIGKADLSLAGAFQPVPQPSENLTPASTAGETTLDPAGAWATLGPVDTSTWAESTATECRQKLLGLNQEDVISNDCFGDF